jgi:hypothetical protein
MTQLERDYHQSLLDRADRAERQLLQRERATRRMLGIILGLIFLWAVCVTTLLEFLRWPS